nr:hypothetical protein [Tanacetum cinerariifolium]
HAAAGLAVYQNNYRAQLVSCLEHAFPQLRSWLGEEAFRHTAIDHIEHFPPYAWTLDAYAEHFDETLRRRFPENPDIHELAWIEQALRAYATGQRNAGRGGWPDRLAAWVHVAAERGRRPGIPGAGSAPAERQLHRPVRDARGSAGRVPRPSALVRSGRRGNPEVCTSAVSGCPDRGFVRMRPKPSSLRDCSRLLRRITQQFIQRVGLVLECAGEDVAVLRHVDASLFDLCFGQGRHGFTQYAGQQLGEFEHFVMTVSFGFIHEQALQISAAAAFLTPDCALRHPVTFSTIANGPLNAWPIACAQASCARGIIRSGLLKEVHRENQLGRIPSSAHQPHARALPYLCRDHGADPSADLRRFAPCAAGSGRRVPQWCDSAAGVRDSCGALRLLTISVGEGPGPS